MCGGKKKCKGQQKKLCNTTNARANAVHNSANPAQTTQSCGAQTISPTVPVAREMPACSNKFRKSPATVNLQKLIRDEHKLRCKMAKDKETLEDLAAKNVVDGAVIDSLRIETKVPEQLLNITSSLIGGTVQKYETVCVTNDAERDWTATTVATSAVDQSLQKINSQWSAVSEKINAIAKYDQLSNDCQSQRDAIFRRAKQVNIDTTQEVQTYDLALQDAAIAAQSCDWIAARDRANAAWQILRHMDDAAKAEDRRMKSDDKKQKKAAAATAAREQSFQDLSTETFRVGSTSLDNFNITQCVRKLRKQYPTDDAGAIRKKLNAYCHAIGTHSTSTNLVATAVNQNKDVNDLNQLTGAVALAEYINKGQTVAEANARHDATTRLNNLTTANLQWLVQNNRVTIERGNSFLMSNPNAANAAHREYKIRGTDGVHLNKQVEPAIHVHWNHVNGTYVKAHVIPDLNNRPLHPQTQLPINLPINDIPPGENIIMPAVITAGAN